MSIKNLSLLAGLTLVSLLSATVHGQTLIVADDYNVTGSGSGFALNTGVNSGINPPTTRLGGSAAPGLRYYKYSGDRADNKHTITANKYSVGRADFFSTVTLTTGTVPYDFSSALHTVGASVAQPSVYEFTITMNNPSWANQRCSFGLSSDPGGSTAWDFGLQIYRNNTTEDFYTIQKRIDAASSGLSGDLDLPITTTPVGTWTNGSISFLVRITDAGAESTGYHSRVQVSTNSGASWIYDTSSDPDLPNGWHFDTAGRYFFWDVGAWGIGNWDDFSLNWISGPTELTQTWTGAGADANWSTRANWQSGAAPTNGDKLIFSGTGRQANVNNLSGLFVPWLTFNNGGFNLAGNALSLGSGLTNGAGNNTLSLDTAWASPVAKAWQVTAGTELTLGGFNVVDGSGNLTVAGGGTVRVKGGLDINSSAAFIVNEGQAVLDGGTFNSPNGFRIGSLATAAAPVSAVVSNGATLTLEAAGANIRVGDGATNVVSRLVVNNGTVDMAGGAIGIPYAAGCTGEVVQVGGLVRGGPIAFSDNGAGVGTYAVTNGVLEPLQIRRDVAGGRATMRFQNATLRPASGANSASFLSGLDEAEIQSGGLTLDATMDVTIGQTLTGAGGLTKVNLGAVTLTGANAYAGNTLVQEGKLVLPTVQSNAAALQVASGAELGVLRAMPNTTLAAGSLSLGSSTLSFDLGGLANPAVPLLRVTTLSASGGAGSVLINLTGGSALTLGQFTLVDYSGSIGGGFSAFTLGALPSGVTATLVNNTANSSIDLNVTAAPGLRWTGANGSSWDYGAMSWYDEGSKANSTFADGRTTWFLDGAASGNIDLGISPAPTTLIVNNNTLTYRFSGGGTISTPLLRKEGSGVLTLATEYFNLITALELNAGSVVVDHPYDTSWTTVLSDITAGLGTFVKTNTTTLSLDGDNSTFDGTIYVAQGMLKAGTTNALGTTNGPTIIANGATLDINNQNLGVEPVMVSGAGVNGAGALIDSTAATAVQRALQNVTLVGDTTIGGPGRWDFKAAAATDPGIKGNGYKLTKVGANWTAIAGDNGAVWNTDLGNIEIQQGTLSFENGATMGRAASNLVVYPGAMLTLFNTGVSNVQSKQLFMTNATMRLSGPSAGGGTGVFGGVITLSGSNRFEVLNGAVFALTNEIRGDSDFVKTATDDSGGTLTLGAFNSYTGLTVVESSTNGGPGYSGKLRIQNAHALGTTSVGTIVNAGGSLELEGPLDGSLYEPLQLAGGGGSGSPGALRNVAGNNTCAGPVTISNPGATTRIANGASGTVLTLDVPAGNAIIALEASNTLLFAGGGAIVVNDPIVLGNGTLQAQCSGTLWLNSTVDAPVQVNSGTLSGVGPINNHLFVSGGKLAPGIAIGTLTVNGDLWMTNTAIFEINKSDAATNDMVRVGGALNVGGTLTVNNLGPALVTGDTFKLFNKAAAGAFSVTNLPALAAGLSWSNSLAVDGTLRVVGSASKPQFNAPLLAANNLILTGTGGVAGNNYCLLTSTNVAAPSSNWTALPTNQFGAGGQFSNAIPVNPGEPSRFFRLLAP
jgi:autotransporter-associated beta strand protein